MRAPKVDDAVSYYAEGKPYTGPYAATVTAVDEKAKTVDLIVTFGTALRSKHGVQYSEQAQKHCWSWPPPRE